MLQSFGCNTRLLSSLNIHLLKILVFFIFIVSTPLFANNYWKLALDKKLYNLAYWNLLLHNINGVSEIENKSFFISKNGKYSAKSEMKATLKALLHETVFNDDSTACRFPARKRYLQEQLAIPNSAFSVVKCTKYEQAKRRLQPYSASLVFPAGHKNSPASMFGHSFIRIDNKSGSRLLSYAVNYAAYTDEKNGFVYALGGLFGLYQGRYSLLPYYEKIKEYVYSQQRDIWEYDLNLTPKETIKIFEHIWEIKEAFSYYYFIRQNCSYNLLWLLEIARPGVYLRDKFLYQVIPVETIFAVDHEKLIKKTHYRPSRYKKILKLSKYLSNEDIDLAVRVANGKINPKVLPVANKQKKRLILQTAVEYFQYKNSQALLKKNTNYRRRYLIMLKALSKLGRGKKIKKKEPVNPLKGHRSTRITLGTGIRNQYNYQSLALRLSFHDLTDSDDGFIRGTHIEFFNTTLALFKNKVSVERFNILNIESFSPRNIFFKPVSWRVKVALDRDLQDDVIAPTISSGAGLSWGNDFGFIYITSDIKGYYKNKIHIGLGGSFGGVWQQNSKAKMVFESSYTYFYNGFKQPIYSISENIALAQNYSISLSYKQIKKLDIFNEKILLGFRYYF